MKKVEHKVGDIVKIKSCRESNFDESGKLWTGANTHISPGTIVRIISISISTADNGFCYGYYFSFPGIEDESGMFFLYPNEVGLATKVEIDSYWLKELRES